jgi:hypothetical protein
MDYQPTIFAQAPKALLPSRCLEGMQYHSGHLPALISEDGIQRRAPAQAMDLMCGAGNNAVG